MWNVELSASPMKNYSIKNYNILHSTFNIATGNNSTFNTPHSTLPQAIIQHSTLNIQHSKNGYSRIQRGLGRPCLTL